MTDSVQSTLEDIARAWFAACVRLEEQAIADASFEDSGEFDATVDDAIRAADRARQRLENDDWATTTAIANAELGRRGMVLEPDGEAYRSLCRLLLRAVVEAARVKAERLNGDPRPKPQDPLFVITPPPPAPGGWRP